MDILSYLSDLRPIDMSVTMLVFALIDLWTALSLSIKAKSTLSKSLMKGFLFNLLIIVIPFGLGVIPRIDFFDASHMDAKYLHFLSMVATVMYIFSCATSILANYSAAYPESKNWLTALGYKYLPREISDKQNKHGLTNDD